MADSYVKVTKQGWGQRLGGSIKGIVVGVMMVAGGLFLLFWGEGRAVKRAKALDEGATTVISVDAAGPRSGDEGGLVHFTGETDTFEPVVDPRFGIRTDAVKLIRQVEMYQWREDRRSEERKKLGGGTETVTTYSYDTGWSEKQIDSSSFEKPDGHRNPSFPFAGEVFTADPVVIGDWILGPVFLGKLSRDEEVRVDDSDLAKVDSDLRETLRADSGRFYLGGDPSAPQVGDVRISFSRVPKGTISVVGQQRGQQLAAYKAKVGGHIALLSPGIVAADAMFEAAKASNKTLTWILRLVGFVVVFIGFGIILKPLSVLADVVPLLGNLVGAGTGFVAFLLAAILSLLTIAVGWLVYRPLLGVALLALAGGLIFWLAKKLTTNRPDRFEGRAAPPPGGAAPPPPPPPPPA